MTCPLCSRACSSLSAHRRKCPALDAFLAHGGVHDLGAVLQDAGIARVRLAVARTLGSREPEHVFRAATCALLAAPRRPQHRAVRCGGADGAWRIRRRDSPTSWSWHETTEGGAIEEINAVMCAALQRVADDPITAPEVAQSARRALVEAPLHQYHGEWLLDIMRVVSYCD
jgi:hypothetical protein